MYTVYKIEDGVKSPVVTQPSHHVLMVDARTALAKLSQDYPPQETVHFDLDCLVVRYLAHGILKQVVFRIVEEH